MTRQRSRRVVEHDERLRPRFRALQAEHPFWGYRRLWADLRFVAQLSVNKKRVGRVMWEHHLLVPPSLRLRAKRTPQGRQPKPTKPHEWWGIDMTKVLVEGVGWVYVVIGLDWYTKVVVGYYTGLRCTAIHWLEALDMAVNRQFPHGARGRGVSLMSANGCPPTSAAFMRACATLESHQAFTRDHNPKGNADTERFRRTRKEECLWRQEWTCPLELPRALKNWLAHYNAHYLQSTLGYQSPRPFERDCLNLHSPPFVAA
jgi:putative transposase